MNKWRKFNGTCLSEVGKDVGIWERSTTDKKREAEWKSNEAAIIIRRSTDREAKKIELG
jgi:hypothetical protein